jgi:ABC-type branched-subunit amino acid transport system substrate-binding protein
MCGLVATLQFACSMAGFGPAGVPPEERLAYDSAMGNLPADPRAAETALQEFLAMYPKSSLADDAAEQLADLAFAADREDEGLRWLGRILSESPDSDRAATARLRLAQFEYARNRGSMARRLLAPLRLERLSLSDQRAALRLRVVLAETPRERLGHLSDLRRTLDAEIHDPDRDAASRRRLAERLVVVDQQIRERVRRATTEELEVMLRDLRRDPPAGRILLELSRRDLDSGELGRAAERIDRAESLLRSELERSDLHMLRERFALFEASAEAAAELPPLRALVEQPRPRTDGARGKIGVVLPLSGDFSAFGVQSLRGILLAAGLFELRPEDQSAALRPLEGDRIDATTFRAGDEPGAAVVDRAMRSERLEPRSEIRLIVRDTEGDPGKAAAAVLELAADPDIVAIVGPIFSAESLAAAEAAERAAMPLVSLSHREEVPAGRAYVFRTRTTPADEVGALVDYAVDVLEARRFAVMYPQNRYGRGMRKLYWDAVIARGGKMVAASSYEPEATDFGAAIRDMIGYRFLTGWERKALAERSKILQAARTLAPQDAALVHEAVYSILGPELQPLPPIVDFDVLFIPDAADKVSLIAPGLAAHEIRNVRLLGSSDWLDEKLLAIGRQHVSGSVVSTPFYPQSDLPFVAEFVEAFRRTFDEEPDAYAAQAFDACNLVLVQLAAARDDRGEMRDGLLRIRAYPGATGVLTMRPDGNARRRPFLLGVKGRRFVPLD